MVYNSDQIHRLGPALILWMIYCNPRNTLHTYTLQCHKIESQTNQPLCEHSQSLIRLRFISILQHIRILI